MPQNVRTTFAKTTLAIPPICFGTSALRDMPDTYGYGVDEVRIGAALRERGGLPKGFVISSKLDRNVGNNLFDGDRAKAYDLSPNRA